MLFKINLINYFINRRNHKVDQNSSAIELDNIITPYRIISVQRRPNWFVSFEHFGIYMGNGLVAHIESKANLFKFSITKFADFIHDDKMITEH